MHIVVRKGEGTPQFRFVASCHADAFMAIAENAAVECGYERIRRHGRGRKALTASPIKLRHGFLAKLRIMVRQDEEGGCEAIVRHGGWFATSSGGSPRSVAALREIVQVIEAKLVEKDKLVRVSKEPEYVVSLVRPGVSIPDLWRW